MQRKPTLRKFAVVSPVYEVGGINEPPETTCDYVVVDAPTKRVAKVAGLREMRQKFPYGYWWGSTPGSPFAGLTVHEVCPHELPLDEAQAGWCQECGGPGPCHEPLEDDVFGTRFCTLLGGHAEDHSDDAT